MHLYDARAYVSVSQRHPGDRLSRPPFLASNGLVLTEKELPMVQTGLELAQSPPSEAEFARYLRCNRDPAGAAGDP